VTSVILVDTSVGLAYILKMRSVEQMRDQIADCVLSAPSCVFGELAHLCVLSASLMLFAVPVVLTSSCARWEPTLVVTGAVRDAATGKPIAGATVSDDGYGSKPPRGTTTDSTGVYRFATWPEEHNILARARGYRPKRQVLVTSPLGTDKQKGLDFTLEAE
jgi:hypothetical protein